MTICPIPSPPAIYVADLVISHVTTTRESRRQAAGVNSAVIARVLRACPRRLYILARYPALKYHTDRHGRPGTAVGDASS